MSSRKVRLEDLNALQADVEDVAEAIKLRVMSRRGAWEVYVNPAGAVFLEQTRQPRYAKAQPEGWLIGAYTSKVPVIVIEEDLIERLREIGAPA